MRQTIAITCNRDCGGSCPLLAHIEDGRLVQIEDNPLGGAYMQGCVRGYQYARTLYAPDRLLTPLIRTGARGSGQFRAASWDEALDLVAERLADIRERCGAESVLHLGGSGSCRGALHNTSRLGRRFLSLFGGPTGVTGTTGGYSSAAVSFVLPHVLGTGKVGSDPGTLAHSKLIILWGANPVDCRFGPDLTARIAEARARGVPVVVIDPRRSRTVAELGTEWLQVRPGTDAALMLAVLYVLLDEGLADRAFIERYSVGFDALEAYVLGQSDGVAKTPAWAEAICGTPAAEIATFARLYGTTVPAALLPGLSIQRTIGGEEAARLGIALQVATGNLGVVGGSAGALTWGGLPGPKMGEMSSLKPPTKTIPVYEWPDAVLAGRAGGYPTDIHAAYTAGANYVVQGSDVRKNIRAMESLEFAVAHEIFMTDTARCCDVVLPATTALERNDIVFGCGNYVLYSNQVVPPQGQARNDYDIFCDLAARLGFEAEFSEGKDEDGWLRGFMAESEVADYDEFRRTGIYFGAEQCRTAFTDYVADPQAHRLNTPSGKVELAPATYAVTGFPAVPTVRVLPTEPAYPLRLVTPKSKFRVHSQNANLAWFVEHEPQALWMHADDAAARGIVEGDMVNVESPQGRLRVVTTLSNAIMQGVVCLQEGAWPSFAAVGGVDGAEGVDEGASANVLTSTEPTLPSHGSRTHSVLVEVSRN